MKSLTNDSSRFCYYCGFENPQNYRLCGNCGGENPVSVSATAVQRHVPQPAFLPLLVEMPKSRLIYIILGLFFGMLGIHNFYANRKAEGAAQLIFLLLFYWTIIAPAAVFVWSIVDVCTVKVDGNGIPMR